ncbi:MAG: hypothetical protein DSY90_15325 [Deltaproteobacteria bacterium]|nr:MAG: hypothetical protein DSY90_15325 [Deltaproteobacteria bacterium]
MDKKFEFFQYPYRITPSGARGFVFWRVKRNRDQGIEGKRTDAGVAFPPPPRLHGFPAMLFD